jgi:hypothetical protein
MSNLPVRRIRGIKSTNTRSKRAFITKVYGAMLLSVGKEASEAAARSGGFCLRSMLGWLSGREIFKNLCLSSPFI